MSEDKKPGALGLEDAMEHVKVKTPEAAPPVVNEVEVLDEDEGDASEDEGEDSGQDSEDEDLTVDEEDV